MHMKGVEMEESAKSSEWEQCSFFFFKESQYQKYDCPITLMDLKRILKPCSLCCNSIIQ